jgi:GNAT superfamily N-acetyltransferase
VTLSPDWTAVARVADGRTATLRFVRPDDRELYRGAFRDASRGTVFRRFLTWKTRLSEADLDYLTQVDGFDHVAVVAVAEGRGVGSARFVRRADEPTEADFAIAIADDWQGLGLGRAMLLWTAAAARDRGVLRFRGEMLASNSAMFRLLDSVAPNAEWLTDGTVALFTFDLDALPPVPPS